MLVPSAVAAIMFTMLSGNFPFNNFNVFSEKSGIFVACLSGKAIRSHHVNQANVHLRQYVSACTNAATSYN